MSSCIRAEIDIDAPVKRVWEILTDLSRYHEWNPFTPKVESTLRVGDPVRLTVQMRPNRRLVQVETVTTVETDRRLCWAMKILAPPLLAAERCQTLTALDGGRTRYVTADNFRGVLFPLVNRLYGADIQRGFTDVAESLKIRAET